MYKIIHSSTSPPLMALLPAMDASMIYISFFCYSPYRPVLNLPYPFPLGSSLNAGAYMHLHKPPKNLWKSAPVFEITHFCWAHYKCKNNRPTHFCPITQKSQNGLSCYFNFEIRQWNKKLLHFITVFGVVGGAAQLPPILIPSKESTS